MTDDIVTRLTRVAEGKFDSMSLDLLREAAAEIERLRALVREGGGADEDQRRSRGMAYGVLQLREPYAGEARRD